jgi:hypothetical protein
VVEQLELLVGDWSLEADFPDAPSGRASFEWLTGKQFMTLRWSVPVPEAPDGLALMGWDEGRGSLLQHYFDSRGVCRVYTMSFGDGRWEMTRTKPDFSPLDFSQRWTATVSEDLIEGTWEITGADGEWNKDFDLSYRRI